MRPSDLALSKPRSGSNVNLVHRRRPEAVRMANGHR
jgi:hypothetical protein